MDKHRAKGICWKVGKLGSSETEGSKLKAESGKVLSIEEIAWRLGYIDAEQVRRLAEPYLKNEYGQYLMDIVNEDW